MPTSKTAKFTQKIFGDNIYWEAMNRKEQDYARHIYTFNNRGEETRVPYSFNGIYDFSVYGNNMLLVNSGNRLVKFDLKTKAETFIFVSGWPYSSPIATADKVYITDLTNSPDPGTHCEASINAFDLTTLEKTTIKANIGMTDYSVEDVWKDWMVYVNCNEGNPDPERYDQCCTGWGHGDVFLYNLKTKEEWNLTNSFGDQISAHIWGPMVVWKDGRHHENGEGKALYGIDLCMHPELKNKFKECASH